MNYRHMLLCGCFVVLGLSTALAAARTPVETFTAINQCIEKETTPGCRDLVTASSISLYDRFVSYGLVRCLPQHSTFISQERKGNSIIIHASATTQGNVRKMRLVLAEEEGEWKLDIPESLHLAMGDKWEQQVTMTEQVYLMMKKNLGAQLNCDAIMSLVKPKQAN
jgi:hypothetical protein